MTPKQPTGPTVLTAALNDLRMASACLYDARGVIADEAERYKSISEAHAKIDRALALLGEVVCVPTDSAGASEATYKRCWEAANADRNHVRKWLLRMMEAAGFTEDDDPEEIIPAIARLRASAPPAGVTELLRLVLRLKEACARIPEDHEGYLAPINDELADLFAALSATRPGLAAVPSPAAPAEPPAPITLFQLQRQVESLTAQVLAFQAATAPFAELVNKTKGRIPVELLSFSHWHELTTVWNKSMGLKPHTPAEIAAILDNLKSGNCNGDDEGSAHFADNAPEHLAARAAEPQQAVGEVVDWNNMSAAHYIGTTVHMLRALPIGTKLYAEPVSGAGDAKDAERLDWLDRNLGMKMGWRVGVAPAGNVSITSVVQLGGGDPTPIRAAIDAALAAARPKP